MDGLVSSLYNPDCHHGGEIFVSTKRNTIMLINKYQVHVKCVNNRIKTPDGKLSCHGFYHIYKERLKTSV